MTIRQALRRVGAFVVQAFWAGLVCAQAAEIRIVPGAFNSGKAMVPCVFDGVKMRCMLDTGSAMTVVRDGQPFQSYEAAGSFEFKSAAGIARKTETILVREIRLAGLSFTNIGIGRLDGQADAENMLGIDLVGRQPFAMMFKQSPSLRFDAKPPSSWRSDLRVSKHGLLAVPLAFGDAQTLALWDTGASLTAVDPVLVEKHPANFKALRTPMQGVDGGGHALVLPVYRARKIFVGGRAFRNLHVVAVDLSILRTNVHAGIEAVAGFNLIRKADWHFDRAQKLWTVR